MKIEELEQSGGRIRLTLLVGASELARLREAFASGELESIGVVDLEHLDSNQKGTGAMNLSGKIAWNNETGFWAVADENGEVWDVFTQDTQDSAIQHPEIGAAVFAHDAGMDTGTIYRKVEGDTWGVNSQDEFIVNSRGNWEDNLSDDAS